LTDERAGGVVSSNETVCARVLESWRVRIETGHIQVLKYIAGALLVWTNRQLQLDKPAEVAGAGRVCRAVS
jgi:hypothetical protein